MTSELEKIVLRDPYATDVVPGTSPDVAMGEARIVVVKGMLLSLGDAMSAQERSDVQNSLLFAQLAADAVANRIVDPKAGTAQYDTVLSMVGWLKSAFSDTTRDCDPPVDWSAITEDDLPADVRAEAIRAIEAADALAEGAAARQVWSSAVTGATGINYALGICSPDGDAPQLYDVRIVAGAIFDERKFLDWNADWQMMISNAERQLSEDVYAAVRETVEKKLGDKIAKYVIPIE